MLRRQVNLEDGKKFIVDTEKDGDCIQNGHYEDENCEQQSFSPLKTQRSLSSSRRKEWQPSRRFLSIMMICTIIIHILISFYFDFGSNHTYIISGEELPKSPSSSPLTPYHRKNSNVIFGHLHYPSKLMSGEK